MPIGGQGLYKVSGSGVDTARYKYAFNGINDYIRVPYFSDLNVGAGAYTCHFWLQCSNAVLNQYFDIFLWLNSNNHIRMSWAPETVGNQRTLFFSNFLAGVGLYADTGYNNNAAPNNLKYTYAHLAFTRFAGVMYLYVNGTLYLTMADNRNYNLNFELWVQGTLGFYQNATVDRLRFIKGQAIWSGGAIGINLFDPYTIDYSTFPTNGIYFPANKSNDWNINQGSNTFIAKNAIVGKPNGIIHGRTTADIGTFYQNI